MTPGSTLALGDVVTAPLGADDSDAPLLEVADRDATVHPLTTSTSIAPASTRAHRWVVPPRSTTGQAYSLPLRRDYG
jgi:hypothetical protein